MKYHTTPSTVIISFLLLLLSVTLVWGGMTFLGLKDPTTVMASDLVSSLDTDGPVRVSISSIERDLFRQVVVKDLSVSVKNPAGTYDTVATIESVSIHKSLQHVLASLFGGDTQFVVDIDGLTAVVDDALLASLGALAPASATGSSPSKLIESWLKRSSFEVHLNQASAKLDLQALQLQVSGINGNLLLGPDLAIGNSNLKIDAVEGNINIGNDMLKPRLSNLSASIQRNASGTLRLSASMVNNHLSFPGGSASVGNINIWTDVSDLQFTSLSKGIALYSLDSIIATYGLYTIDMAKITGSVALSGDGSVEATVAPAAVNAIAEIDGQHYQVSIPTSKLAGKFSADGTVSATFSLSTNSPVSAIVNDADILNLSNISANIQGGGTSYNGSIRWKNLWIADANAFEDLLSGLLDVKQLPLQKFGSTDGQVNIGITPGTFIAELYSKLDIGLEDMVPSQLTGILTASADYDRATHAMNIYGQIEDFTMDSVPGTTKVLVTFGTDADNLTDLTLQVENSEAGISLDAQATLPEQAINAQLRLTEFAPSAFSGLTRQYAPFLDSYIDLKTRINGTFLVDALPGNGKLVPFDARTSFELAIVDLQVGDRFFNGASTFAGTLTDDLLDIQTFTATTEGYRLQYTGSIQLEHMLPQGQLRVELAEDGSNLVQVDFSLLPPQRYQFDITSGLLKSVSMTGEMTLQDKNIIQSNAQLHALDMEYPIDLRVDMAQATMDMRTSGLSIGFMLNDNGRMRASVKADSFTLPMFGDLQVPMVINGDLQLVIPMDTYAWDLQLNDFKVVNLPAVESVGSLSLDLSVDASHLAIDNIVWDSVFGEPMEGQLSLQAASLADLVKKNVTDGKFLFYLDGGPGESISISLFEPTDQRGTVEGMLDIKSFMLGRVSPSLSEMETSLSLVGTSDLQQHISLDGKLNLRERFQDPENLNVDANLLITDDLVKLYGIMVENGPLSVRDALVSVNFSTGEAELGLQTKYIVQNADRPRTYGGTFGLKAVLPLDKGVMSFNDGYDKVLGMYHTLMDDVSDDSPFVLDLSIRDVVVGDDYTIPDGNYTISLGSGQATVIGGVPTEAPNINGSYRFSDGAIDLRIDPSFLLGFHMKGTLLGRNISVRVTDIFFPLPLINATFLKPILKFHKGDVHGDIWITGDPLSPNFYGMAWADRIDLWVFWVPDDIISLKNPVVSMEEGFATTSLTPLTATSSRTGEIVTGLGKASVNLDGWMLDYYDVEAQVPDKPVFVRIPILGADIDIQGYGAGNFFLHGTNDVTWISGDFLIDDTSISFGVDGLPAWYVPVEGGKSSTDVSVTTGKNVNFYFPTADSPIITATIDEGQHITFTYDHTTDTTTADGVLAFRSGEIYYFQKNFYITQGSLKFRTDVFTNEIVPVINMRARMRDLDANGNKVDIYLVLQDSTLDNISPYFESVPSLTTNEIMEILGQSILPSSAYGQVNVSSVVSLAATATDVISRLGLIGSSTSGLTNSIKTSLGLDMFTLRSNIVQNILFDVLPGNTLGYTNASPLARYLDNTTISLGKYIGSDFFLQGMIHFSASPYGQGGGFFLAEDLEVDMELSVEWANPVGTFSLFTQPDELSLFSILDTIGFSVTKRIEF